MALIASAEVYNIPFETIGLHFESPAGTRITDYDVYNSLGNIDFEFSDGHKMSAYIYEVSDWEEKLNTAESSEEFWHGYGSYEDESPLTTTPLQNGDYTTYGRYIDYQTMHTKITRTLDLNEDGYVDYYVNWISNGKVDESFMNSLAITTDVYSIEPDWD